MDLKDSLRFVFFFIYFCHLNIFQNKNTVSCFFFVGFVSVQKCPNIRLLLDLSSDDLKIQLKVCIFGLFFFTLIFLFHPVTKIETPKLCVLKRLSMPARLQG